MPNILFDDVTFLRRSGFSLRNLTMSVSHNEVLCLLGVSGSGKSTVLHLMAGLLTCGSGKIILGDRIVDARGCFVVPGKRGISMVFQTPALLPYKNVYDNITFAAGVGVGDGDIDEYLECVNMLDCKQRYPHELSLGQQQRVSLARAFASGADIMLLDEPFANLDPSNKFRVRRYLYSMIKKFDRTVVLVTHDPEDAMLLADRVYVMDNGKIIQDGTLESMYRHPKNLFVARFFGELNVISFQITQQIDVCNRLCIPNSVMNNCIKGSCFKGDGNAFLCFRPENVSIVPVYSGSGIEVCIEEVRFFGAYYWLRLRCQCGFVFNIRADHSSCSELPLSVGAKIRVVIDSKAVMMFDENDYVLGDGAFCSQRVHAF